MASGDPRRQGISRGVSGIRALYRPTPGAASVLHTGDLILRYLSPLPATPPPVVWQAESVQSRLPVLSLSSPHEHPFGPRRPDGARRAGIHRAPPHPLRMGPALQRLHQPVRGVQLLLRGALQHPAGQRRRAGRPELHLPARRGTGAQVPVGTADGPLRLRPLGALQPLAGTDAGRADRHALGHGAAEDRWCATGPGCRRDRCSGRRERGSHFAGRCRRHGSCTPSPPCPGPD